ncbi:hypothetical protein [Krasilnikovia sp. MM14-A1004]|uniref:hypothetical protein n=1 Tax=Krasilnikovia sp. MM14-A1004 TaxID=3373541 RepID=UPI00399C97F0
MIFFEDGDNSAPARVAEPQRRVAGARYVATNLAVFVVCVALTMVGILALALLTVFGLLLAAR